MHPFGMFSKYHSALVSCIVCMLLYLLVCMLHLQVIVFKRASWRSVESIFDILVVRRSSLIATVSDVGVRKGSSHFEITGFAFVS